MLRNWGNFFSVYCDKKQEIEKMKRQNIDNVLTHCINSLEDNIRELANKKIYMDNCIKKLKYEHQIFLELRSVKKYQYDALECKLNMCRSNLFRTRNMVLKDLSKIMNS